MALTPTDTRSLLAAALAALNAKERRAQTAKVNALIRAGGATPAGLVTVLDNAQLPIEVRQTACWAIEQLRYKAALPALGRILEDGRHPLWSWAYHVLTVLRDQRVAPRLLRLIHTLTDAYQRAALLGHLGCLLEQTHGPRLPHIVLELTQILAGSAEDATVRSSAAEALGLIGHLAAYDPLLAALRDPAAEVRLFAAFALGDLGDPRAIPALEAIAATDFTAVPAFGTVAQDARDSIERLQRKAVDAD